MEFLSQYPFVKLVMDKFRAAKLGVAHVTRIENIHLFMTKKNVPCSKEFIGNIKQQMITYESVINQLQEEIEVKTILLEQVKDMLQNLQDNQMPDIGQRIKINFPDETETIECDVPTALICYDNKIKSITKNIRIKEHDVQLLLNFHTISAKNRDDIYYWISLNDNMHNDEAKKDDESMAVDVAVEDDQPMEQQH